MQYSLKSIKMTKLQTLGLVEVTTQRQADRGTQAFHDPQTGCDYISYESGYVRRILPHSTHNSSRAIYQLNRTIRVPSTWGLLTRRILELSADTRLDIIARSTINYRNKKRS
jgi:hypothetical protein